MLTAEYCCSVFLQVIEAYHTSNDVDEAFPFQDVEHDIHHFLKLKSWIDTVQWHLEDIIRKPDHQYLHDDYLLLYNSGLVAGSLYIFICL